MKDEIYQKLLHIEEKTPVLLIGMARTIFKENYSKSIITINSVEDYKDLLNNQSLDKIVVLDLFYIHPLLKVFLKSTSRPIILLTENDYIDIDYLLDIKTIIKVDSNISSLLLGSSQAQKKWKETVDKSNIYKFYVTDSPELYYLKKKYSLNKYIDLFASDNVS